MPRAGPGHEGPERHARLLLRFSDGGLAFAPKAAVAHGLALLEQGADIVDVGGESTLPPDGVWGRDAATAAVSALAAAQGAWCLRVHDVASTLDAVRVIARWGASLPARVP